MKRKGSNITSTPRKQFKTQPRSLINPPSRKYVQPELKNIDTAGSVGNLIGGQWSEVDWLNSIPIGNSASSRIGRKVTMKSFYLRWISSTGSAPDTPIRVLVIYDRSPEGALPVITDILQTDNFLSPMSLGEGDRFTILSDKVHPTITGVGTGINYVQKYDSVFRKLNLQSVYNANGGTIADCTQGAIYVMCCVSNAVSGVGIGYYSRIRYTDV